MNETLQTLETRRSIRKFKREQLAPDTLNAILRAGTFAPSGMGKQSAVMVAIQNPETIALLSKLNAAVLGKDVDPFYGAPTVVVVLSDSEWVSHFEDGCLVMGNLMNAAASLGVGSCWIYRAREVFQSEEGKMLLREWGIPEHYVGIGHCILGYPDQNVQAAPRKKDYVVRIP